MIRDGIFRHRVAQAESRLCQRLANVLHRCDEEGLPSLKKEMKFQKELTAVDRRFGHRRIGTPNQQPTMLKV